MGDTPTATDHDPFLHPLMGVIRVGAHQPPPALNLYMIHCAAGGTDHLAEIVGDVWGALDHLGYAPTEGWGDDDEPRGSGWLCPACARAAREGRDG